MPKIRRIYNSGNSLVISIPREYLEALSLGKDDTVWLKLDLASNQLLISPVHKSKNLPIQPNSS